VTGRIEDQGDRAGAVGEIERKSFHDRPAQRGRFLTRDSDIVHLDIHHAVEATNRTVSTANCANGGAARVDLHRLIGSGHGREGPVEHLAVKHPATCQVGGADVEPRDPSGAHIGRHVRFHLRHHSCGDRDGPHSEQQYQTVHGSASQSSRFTLIESHPQPARLTIRQLHLQHVRIVNPRLPKPRRFTKGWNRRGPAAVSLDRQQGGSVRRDQIRLISWCVSSAAGAVWHPLTF
jgi:hypothetical protein